MTEEASLLSHQFAYPVCKIYRLYHGICCYLHKFVFSPQLKTNDNKQKVTAVQFYLF